MILSQLPIHFKMLNKIQSRSTQRSFHKTFSIWKLNHFFQIIPVTLSIKNYSSVGAESFLQLAHLSRPFSVKPSPVKQLLNVTMKLFFASSLLFLHIIHCKLKLPFLVLKYHVYSLLFQKKYLPTNNHSSYKSWFNSKKNWAPIITKPRDSPLLQRGSCV